jgi:SRSO17 transposase
MEPMAQRLGVDKQKIQQFVSDSPWDEQVIWKAIRQKVIPTLEPIDAWIVDETGSPKQGEKSVGSGTSIAGRWASKPIAR